MSIHLSISSYAAGGSPEIAVKRLVKAGFRYSELGGFHSSVLLERSGEEWKKFRAYAEGQGLLFRQGHLPLHNDITLADEDQRRANVAVHRAYCRMYHALGITSAVLHCGGYGVILRKEETPEAVRARRIKSLEELLSDLPEGMTICLENLPYETFEDVNANLADMGYPENLGFCLDTGHLHFCPKPDHVDYILRAGKRLKALHMHDNVGPMAPGGVLQYSGWLGSDKHMFPGFFTGSINWYGVVGALREIGYSDLWNLEIGADVGGDVPNLEWREMVLRQDRERAELLFNYDPDAPDGEDPVNDYGSIASVTSGEVTAAVDKYALKVTTSVYELKVDTVHGGRIVKFRAFGRELVTPDRFLGWAVPSSWAPPSASFVLKKGLKIDGVKAAPDGVEITQHREFTESDNVAVAGLVCYFTDTFTKEGFTRKIRISNPGTKKSAPFAFRFHSMPAILGGRGLESGEVRFKGCDPVVRNSNPFFVRIGGVSDPLLERPLESKSAFIDADTADVAFSAPGTPGELLMSCPGEAPAAICFWDTVSGSSSYEPIWKVRTLAPGESCEFALAVTLRNC